MKIGVIGLGGIAQKAYMPVTMAMQDEIEWHLCTRDPQKLAQLGQKYGVKHLYTDHNALLTSGIEAIFIHTATHTHARFVTAALNAGIHVFVDKPISENATEVAELVALAQQKGLLLMAGFNRRFAPMVQQLKALPQKRMINVQKTRANKPGAPVRFTIYDIFIHSLDTALYLIDDVVTDFRSNIVLKDGGFQRAVVTFETATTSCSVSVNFEAGVNSEIMEVQTPTGTTRLDDLVQYQTFAGNTRTTQKFTDWETTLHKRGFDPMIRAFIGAVKTKEACISAASIVQSHELCERMLNAAGIE
ncbi:Gfo/Idh/MocA family protein [Brochothrix campestris]|uniref:Putative oxidoreductase n=1 Tax=Brochothrix campestris FSL F6-1037 TaxID=1265861 RepID=W7D2G7_9LIST|nr:Gfo/Idh/MocA family oxidoreductase [Brochothrix campestris]EUJ42111.1 putative oxidoreductase [Brochothrix campestris FSL F6-1037]